MHDKLFNFKTQYLHPFFKMFSTPKLQVTKLLRYTYLVDTMNNTWPKQ